MYNELSLISGSTGVSHNGIFRGKNLGTIANLNEYKSFRSAHGIDNKSYKDLYLGDYFKIQDGTYNAVWMVAHFDYYINKGSITSSRGVVLIPRTSCGESKMKNTDTSEGAYANSIAHTTTCPAIANALSTVLGSYLLSNNLLFTTAMNENIPSMMGGNYQGASVNWTSSSSQCELPNEVQIYGSMICSSSFFDVGEANEKLAVFNFINPVEYARFAIWLRDVSSATAFTNVNGSGVAVSSGASTNRALRPLIYIG